jgi:trans-2,3-dihydro-3-hydroxyanthranilate isomerase
MQRRYAILDVFADTPLAGNPLAVVLDVEGLDTGSMQSIAAEFNLSETVFVLPAKNPVHTASLRIFTPRNEIPFAGHPTIGTAVLLGHEAAGDDDDHHESMMVLEEKVGPVRCGVVIKGDKGHAVFDIPQQATAVGEAGEREAIAAALGLVPVEIGFENHHPSVYSAGLPFNFIPVRDLEVIAKARPDTAHWAAAFADNAAGAFLYCRETVGHDHHFHGRMFAPLAGIAEDPATGSAAAAFSAVIMRFDQPTAGDHRYLIEQGFEMKRPSLIKLELDVDAGAVQSARIGGDAVVVAEGTLSL